MYLSLPLPSSPTRTMTITVFSADGSSAPSSYTINVPKFGKCKDLIQAVSISCSLRDNESLLVAEVCRVTHYCNLLPAAIVSNWFGMYNCSSN